MTDITIPPEALEAARKAAYKAVDENGDAIHAACLAVLKAWPGMVDHPETALSPCCLWLPITENTDAP